ncbi:MAG: hypothetical protein WC728_18205 [Elusimicrobiota bacterium]
MKENERIPRSRFLVLLAGVVPALWSILKPKRSRDLELREADFYTRQDLAG